MANRDNPDVAVLVSYDEGVTNTVMVRGDVTKEKATAIARAIHPGKRLEFIKDSSSDKGPRNAQATHVEEEFGRRWHLFVHLPGVPDDG